MMRYQTWSITRWSWQISFDRYSNDRSTIMVTALPRIIRSAQGRPIFGLLRASVYLRTVAGVFLLYFVPGMKCLHAVPVGWMYLIGVMEVAGRRRYWTLSKRLTILKIYSVTSLSRLLSKRFSICCDWLGVEHNRGFYATRSISVCFYSVNQSLSINTQNTFAIE